MTTPLFLVWCVEKNEGIHKSAFFKNETKLSTFPHLHYERINSILQILLILPLQIQISLEKKRGVVSILSGSDQERRDSQKMRHTCGPCFPSRLFSPVADGVQQILTSSGFKGIDLNVYIDCCQQDSDHGVCSFYCDYLNHNEIT